MAGATCGKGWGDLTLTKEEVENLKEALKKEEFRKLLTEYAEELTNPENRKRYQDEIIKLEAERGIDCTFINPEPGFVVKTSVNGNKKAFINICKNIKISRPWSKPAIKENSKGLNWSIPFSQSPGREDRDKKNKRCVVYDVVFHPSTLHLAVNNSQFRKLVVNTALNAIEDSYKVNLDKKNLKYPKLHYKGFPIATVIRKKSKKQPVLTEEEIEFQKNMNYPAPPPVDEDKKPVVRNFDDVKEDKEKYTLPKYIIKHRSGIDLENFTYDKNCKMNAAIPKELVIEVNLPLLNSTKEVTLDVMEKSIHLICEKPAKYKLDIQLPYAVNEKEGSAKFDKDARVLTITLPVIKGKKNVADLMKEDSGVESDIGDRCTSCEDDSSPVGSVDVENKVDDQSDNKSLPSMGSDEMMDKKECQIEKDSSKPLKTSFLDKDKLYVLPTYKCNIDDHNICFLLNVKNVDPKSVQKKLIGSNGCHVKFLSLGAGFSPVFYGFLVKFKDGTVIKNVALDVLDNNVTVQIEMKYSKYTSSFYFAGVDEDSLVRKDLTRTIELEKKFEKMKLDTDIELEDISKERDDEKPVVTVESAETDEVSLQILPVEKSKTPPKEEQKLQTSVKEKKKKKKKARTFSESTAEESTASPITMKSILKNTTTRSLSESNAEEYTLGSSVEASEGSDLCIVEENEESSSVKKTVRFSDRIRKQIFRANSSILGQKKKNQKRSRNKRKLYERRTSESETSELEESDKGTPTTPTTPTLVEEIEEKSNEINCDTSETVISEKNENASDDGKSGEIRLAAKKDDKIFEFKSDLIFHLDL